MHVLEIPDDPLSLDNTCVTPAFSSWGSQAREYPLDGEPGITFKQHYLDMGQDVEILPYTLTELDNVTCIDCVLHRDARGKLDGILVYSVATAVAALGSAAASPDWTADGVKQGRDN